MEAVSSADDRYTNKADVCASLIGVWKLAVDGHVECVVPLKSDQNIQGGATGDEGENDIINIRSVLNWEAPQFPAPNMQRWTRFLVSVLTPFQ